MTKVNDGDRELGIARKNSSYAAEISKKYFPSSLADQAICLNAIIEYRIEVAELREREQGELREQHERNCAFIQKMMQDTAWLGADLQGVDAQDFGEAYGILIPFEVTPEDLQNHNLGDCGEGDVCYKLTDDITEAAERYRKRQEGK